MGKFIRIIDTIVFKMWLGICSVLFIISLFVKASYNMDDFPYFKWNLGIDIVALLICMIIYIFLFMKSFWIEEHIQYWQLFIFFGMLAVLFVFFVPIQTISDPRYVAEGSLWLAKGDINSVMKSEYLQVIAKNIKVSLFYALFDIFLPKNILSLRIINIILYLLVAYYTSKIYYNFFKKNSKVVFIIVASMLSLLFFCNQIYFDLPVLFMCTVGTYFYTKKRTAINILLAGIFIGIGASIRVLSFIFAVAIMIDYIFTIKKEFLNNKIRNILVFLMFVIVVFGIPKITDIGVDYFLRVENAPNESIWGLFWMGINEEEFGMMHNEIAYMNPGNFEGFYNLLFSRTMEQNIRLFGKKIIWTWTQGTYQMQRYGFGYNKEIEVDKFLYSTPLTKYFLNDGQIPLKVLICLCRAQYLAIYFYMIVGLKGISVDKIKHYRMLVYMMFGTFLVLIFYEMKSRYILHCLPAMILLAMIGLEQINSKMGDRKISYRKDESRFFYTKKWH